jgi:hypothetical protein
MHVGVNDITNDLSDREIAKLSGDLCGAVTEAKAKFPGSTIVFSEVLSRDDNDKISSFNHQMEIFCNVHKHKYVNHNLRPSMFDDSKHPGQSGTRIMVANIKRSLGLSIDRSRSQSRGRSSGRDNSQGRNRNYQDYPSGQSWQRRHTPNGHFRRY